MSLRATLRIQRVLNLLDFGGRWPLLGPKQHPAFALVDKIDQFCDFRGQLTGSEQVLDGEFEVLARTKERNKRPAQGADGGGWEARPPESHRVYGTDDIRTVGDAKRRNVATHSAASPSQGEPANPRILMHNAVSRYQRKIAHLDPSRK